MKILAIDWGEQRTGLAIGDSQHKLALPFGVLSEPRLPQLIDQLKKIVVEEGIALLLVGEPKNLSGLESSQSTKTHEFIKLLQASLSVKVITMDERFTTKRAQAPALGRKRQVDELAAMYLLQDYLDQLNLA